MARKLTEVGSLEIINWHFELDAQNRPRIVINVIKVLDKAGKYIKFAKLEKVAAYLDKYPIKFNPKG